MKRPFHIIGIIFARFYHGFCHKTGCSKMNHAVNFIAFHSFCHKSNIMDIALDKSNLFRH